MGGSGSKPATPSPTLEDINKLSVPGIDLSKGTFSGEYLQQVQAQASAALKKAQEGVKTQAGLSGTFKAVAWLLGLALVGTLLAFFIDFIAVKITGRELTGFGWLATPTTSSGPSEVPASSILYIGYARYGTDHNNSSQYIDVTDKVTSMIVV